jgi:hypothetical protein
LRRRTTDAAGSGRRGEDASDSKPGRLAASLRRKTAPSRPAISSQAGAPATPRRPSRPDALRGAGCGSPPTCPAGLRRPVFQQRNNTIIKWRHEIQRAEQIPWQIHQCTSDEDTFWSAGKRVVSAEPVIGFWNAVEQDAGGARTLLA